MTPSRATARWLLILALSAIGCGLAGRAWAQAAEATAVAGKAADIFLDRGVLGASCVFLILLLVVAGLVIRTLYKDIKELNAGILLAQDRLITVAEGAKDAAERNEEALKGLRATLDSRGHLVGDLSHEVERGQQEVRHAFANVSQSLTGIVGMLQSVSGLLNGLGGRRNDGGAR